MPSADVDRHAAFGRRSGHRRIDCPQCPQVFDRLEELARETRARGGSAGVWIEDKASGIILLQQATRRGWPARPIESRLESVGKSAQSPSAAT